jgi:hypothetical protein
MKMPASISMVRVMAAGMLLVDAVRTFGLGSDYRNDLPVGGSSAWPAGVMALANSTNRVHGFFVNAEDILFFSGSLTTFNDFLRDYAKIEGIKQHRLVLHEGQGEAKSPWDSRGKPCDWKIYACPEAWLKADATSKAFILEVHFWTGGNIRLDELAVPRNIDFAGDCLKNFESITNGMTRADVESRLRQDGGLQGVSPVRYIDPACPGFKISVEFDVKRNATGQHRAIVSAENRVICIYKPFIELPFSD